MRPYTNLTTTSLLTTLLFTLATSQTTNGSKRGIAYLGTSHTSDYNIFLSAQSPLSWYYNWSPNPVSEPSRFSTIEFVPLLHNLESLDADLRALSSLPQSSTHLLTFNEPDHDTSGGGTDISPDDAAAAYIDSIAPLSIANGGRWRISHPSTTGTLSGLDWLRRFNTSCYALNETHGCHADFLATHFYGDFPALASWLGTLDAYYNGNASTTPPLPIWVTELALPQQSADATEVMMNATLPFLDGLAYVERYSWFGIFRKEAANGWTGEGVALLDDGGDLTELGAMYLGEGFKEGASASDGSADGGAMGRRAGLGLVVGMGMLCLVLGAWV